MSWRQRSGDPDEGKLSRRFFARRLPGRSATGEPAGEPSRPRRGKRIASTRSFEVVAIDDTAAYGPIEESPGGDELLLPVYEQRSGSLAVADGTVRIRFRGSMVEAHELAAAHRSRVAAPPAAGFLVLDPVAGDTLDLVRRLEALAAEPRFQFLTAPVGPPGPVAGSALGAGLAWWITQIHVKEAWQLVQQLQPAIRAAPVAIVDDGVARTHPALRGALDAPHSIDLADGDSDPGHAPGQWHGTACAALAVGRGSVDAERVGVAPTAPLIAVRVQQLAGLATDPDVVAAGVRHAALHARVISISMTESDALGLTTLGEAVRDVIADGVTVVAAAGNYDANIAYPARYPGVIAVGATNRLGARCTRADWLVADGSCQGPALSVCSPGVDIRSALPCAGLPPACYTEAFNGTSAACAIVAGLCALLLGVRPSLTPADVKRILEQTASLGAARSDELGHGIVDAAAAVAAARHGVV